MKIVLGSQNVPKRGAVVRSFSQAFPGKQCDVTCVSTDSGVAPHPITATEALQGAINRAHDAKRQLPDAEYYVGIEGGLLRVGDRAWEIGWVAICNQAGNIATGLSAGIEIKGRILEAIIDGQELTDVLRDLYGMSEVGNSNGFYGLATGDCVTRHQAYEQGIHFALSQYTHPEFF